MIRPVLSDSRPLWMKRVWWICAYLGSAGVVALRSDWPTWPQKERPVATAPIDSNAAHIDEEGRTQQWAMARHISRPVAVGELVLLIDTGDGADKPFATWGLVTSIHNGLVNFLVVGYGSRNGYLYAEVPQ